MITFFFVLWITCREIMDSKKLDGDKYTNYVLAILIEVILTLTISLSYGFIYKIII